MPLLVETQTSGGVCRREHGACGLVWTFWEWVVVVHAPEDFWVSCLPDDCDPSSTFATNIGPSLDAFWLIPSPQLILTPLHSNYGAFFSYYNLWFVFSTARRLAMANASGIVCTKNYRTNRDYWKPYLWESFIRGRQASRQKWTVSPRCSAAYAYGDHSHFADAKHRPSIASSDAVGVNNATSQSLTDRLTREHRMIPDEERRILNVRPQDRMDILAQVRHSMPFSSILLSTTVQYL